MPSLALGGWQIGRLAGWLALVAPQMALAFLFSSTRLGLVAALTRVPASCYQAEEERSEAEGRRDRLSAVAGAGVTGFDSRQADRSPCSATGRA